MSLRTILVFLILAVPACSIPEGKGVVAGEMFIEGCDGNNSYGTASFPAYFDLRANHIFGETIQDETDSPVAHRLDVRLQRSTNTLGDADALYIQFSRVAATAKRFAAWQLIPVAVGEPVQAALSMYLTCPSFFDGPEAQPRGNACPSVSEEEQQRFCDEARYGKLASVTTPQAPFAEGHSCILLCSFGKARRGESVHDDFEIREGDEVSGIFFFTLQNRRIIYDRLEVCADGADNDGDGVVDEEDCSRITTGGFVQGNFRFQARPPTYVQVIP